MGRCLGFCQIRLHPSVLILCLTKFFLPRSLAEQATMLGNFANIALNLVPRVSLSTRRETVETMGTRLQCSDFHFLYIVQARRCRQFGNDLVSRVTLQTLPVCDGTCCCIACWLTSATSSTASHHTAIVSQ